MKRKNMFAGCSLRLNISQCNTRHIYYCSSSNIIKADSNEIKDVVFLDNDLNFIQIVEDKIISGDSSGRIYIVSDKNIEKYDLKENIQNGCLLNNGKLLCISLNNIYLFDREEKRIITSYYSKEILSTCSYFDNKIYIGTCEGNILLFDIDLSLLKIVPAHYDRIQGSSLTSLDGVTYLATSSKDCTIKIWNCIDNEIEHVQTLNGHSDWVSSVCWTDDGSLVSSSFDKSIAIWSRNSLSAWSNTKIYGGSKPFYNAFEFKDVVYGQSATGGIHKFADDSCDFISGHIDEITSLDWKDSFIMTSSLDKTSRIFLSNREVSRPQNHGCPVTVAKFLNENDLTIISGSQETIIRVLEPTYINYMAITSNSNLNDFMESKNLEYEKIKKQSSPRNIPRNFEGLESYKLAAVPAELSLTNDVVEDFDFEGLNEYILSTTAFNEIKKLYGHYFDVVDIDVSDNHIVSVNKALSKKFSGLFLWNRNYEVIHYLEVHNSTINRVRFSPDGRFICTASKDKSSALLEITDKMIARHLNTDHSRIVWDCAFSHDTKFYGTCSRDKKVIIYEIETNLKIFEGVFDKEITTMDFNPTKYELLIGLESGEIDKIVYEDGLFKVENGFRFKSNSKRINILRFNKDGRYFACGGSDWLLSVFETK